MRAVLTVEMDNAAFEADPRSELARILRELAKRVQAGAGDPIPVFDLNGNRVGELRF